jgi:nucleotide-binding universal stress UspA family protein
MQRIVVAAKAGAEQPWLADAAAQLAEQTGADVSVVSVDGVEMEALSPLPRSEYAERARRSAEAIAARLRDAGVDATAATRPGRPMQGILDFADDQDADLIVVGGSTRGRLAARLLGAVPLELVQRSRRPVVVISPPAGGERG